MTLKGISQRNRELLTELHLATTGPFDVRQAGQALGPEPPRAHRLLAYWASRGWLTRIRRGLYATVPLEAKHPEEWRQDPWVVAAKIFAPLYIGGWSACEHWGLSDQLFRVTIIVTAKAVRARHVTVQGFPFWLRRVRPAKLFGTRSVWRERIPIPVSDPTRTVVDLLDDPGLGGGIREVSGVLRTYLESSDRNDDLLLQYIEQLGNRAVFKRLGYLLEIISADVPAILDMCRRSKSAGVSLLDPSLPPKGPVLRRWNLRVNAALDEAA